MSKKKTIAIVICFLTLFAAIAVVVTFLDKELQNRHWKLVSLPNPIDSLTQYMNISMDIGILRIHARDLNSPFTFGYYRNIGNRFYITSYHLKYPGTYSKMVELDYHGEFLVQMHRVDSYSVQDNTLRLLTTKGDTIRFVNVDNSMKSD